MSNTGEKAAAWVYRGVWGALTDLLNVPDAPPNAPPGSGEIRSLKPSPGYLRYLKMWFWIAAVAFDVCLISGWIVLTIFEPLIGGLLTPIVWAVAIIPDIVAYIALHLRWDTTWYVITDRAVRIRRGIWVIHESTITFENIQNVEIRQGPVQRHFGIANIHIQTAGGSGASSSAGSSGTSTGHDHGMLEGVDHPEELRELFMARAGLSGSAGLGDEHPAGSTGLSPAHIRVLDQIRDALRDPGPGHNLSA
jgi:membrane protein YdbS with pleckstrin-like domain